MYTKEQKDRALTIYDATQSIAEVIRQLGYPSKQALYTWIANRDKPWHQPNGFRGVNTAAHPRHPSVDLKISVLHKKWCLGKSCVEHLFHDPLDNEPLAV